MIEKINGNTEMIFGTEDIAFNSAKITIDDENFGVVFFYNRWAEGTGVDGGIQVPCEVDLNDFPVRMLFSKKESIDKLIEVLIEAKNNME